MKNVILNTKCDLDGEFVKLNFSHGQNELFITSNQKGKTYSAHIDRDNVRISNETSFNDLFQGRVFDTTHFEIESNTKLRNYLDWVFSCRITRYQNHNFASIDDLANVKDCKILLMSGGKDSTYLMELLLRNGHYVCPVYNQFNDFGDVENIINKYCVMNTVEKMANKYPGKIIPDFIETNMTCSNNINASSIHSYNYIQQPFNIFSMVMMDIRILKASDEICFGHISGDECAASWYDELNDLYKSIMKFNQIYDIRNLPETNENVKLPKLTFPLQKMIKTELLFKVKELQNETDYLSRYTMNSCERMNYKGCVITKDYSNNSMLLLNLLYEPCNTCNPCKLEKFLLGKVVSDESSNCWNRNYIVITIPFCNELKEVKPTLKSFFNKDKLTPIAKPDCSVEVCDTEKIKEE